MFLEDGVVTLVPCFGFKSFLPKYSTAMISRENRKKYLPGMAYLYNMFRHRFLQPYLQRQIFLMNWTNTHDKNYIQIVKCIFTKNQTRR